MVFLCLLNGRHGFTNSRGGIREQGSEGSRSLFSLLVIPGIAYNLFFFFYVTCSFPSCSLIYRAADLAQILAQMLWNSPKEVSISQALQCSFRHVNVPDIFSGTYIFLLYTHLFIFLSLLVQLSLSPACNTDPTLNFILNLFIEQQ